MSLPFLWALSLLLALLLGSFLNVCIARLPAHQSIVSPGSHCPLCGAPVRPWDNIPVFSWLLLRGRCRDCGRAISVRYPLVELGYTALIAAAATRFGFTWELVGAAVFCFLALGLLVMDLETMLLPDAFTLTGAVLGVVWRVLGTGPLSGASHESGAVFRSLTAFFWAATAGALWAGLLLAIRWAYYLLRRQHGLGLGDVKLAALLAIWLGNQRMALTFVLAVCGAAVVTLMPMLVPALLGSRKATQYSAGAWRTIQLPLGTFLCGAGLYAFFFGQQAIKWYLHLFL